MNDGKILFCDNCKWSKPKEYEQTKSKKPHVCNVLHIVVFHREFHPRIKRPDNCNYYEIEKRTQYY